ncbi:MAG: DUF302 domain-containing protein [Sulfurimonas sp.]|nr:DUF302 domain-containing protein [Sulfurimonas sp.]
MRNRIALLTTSFMAVFMFSGCTAMNLGMTFMGFSDDTQKAYAGMMDIVSETGDPAQAMMKEWEITDPDLTEEDVFDEMKSLAGDYNMRYVGEKDMFRLLPEEIAAYEKDGIAKADQVVHARIGEFCSLIIAKKMLNHSRFYGGFMPCRVMYVEYGDGRRFLISMDMTLALYGGTDKKPIDAGLMEDMKNVKIAMEAIPAIAAGYDIDEE